ncbi:MAG: hypothetical protein JWN13_5385 [Betaproteobacteria bacterium]|nr:hypothetical protein [Betaproteobacteria bacterium]
MQATHSMGLLLAEYWIKHYREAAVLIGQLFRSGSELTILGCGSAPRPRMSLCQIEQFVWRRSARVSSLRANVPLGRLISRRRSTEPETWT